MGINSLRGEFMDRTEYRKIIENMYDGVYYVDKDREILCWNKAAERITGFKANDVIGSHCYNNVLNHQDKEGNKLCLGGCPLHKTIEDEQARETSVYLHHKEGHRVEVKVRTFPIYDDGELIGAAEVFTDDSTTLAVMSNVEELKYLAMYDQLTELPNRRYIESYLKSKMSEFITVGLKFGILFMDIDHFKAFNDTYGHDIGDDVLRMVSKSFLSAIRSSDLVGRWGGEEFIAVVTGVNANQLQVIAEKIRKLIEMSELRGQNEGLKVTISVGGALITAEDTVESLVKKADLLMYKSKNDGRNRVTIT